MTVNKLIYTKSIVFKWSSVWRSLIRFLNSQTGLPYQDIVFVGDNGVRKTNLLRFLKEIGSSPCIRWMQGGSSRLGWLYRSREEWITAGLLIEWGAVNKSVWLIIKHFRNTLYPMGIKTNTYIFIIIISKFSWIIEK